MIKPGEHISIFGLSGCGKSTLTGKLADLFPRKIIFDRMAEWQNRVKGAITVHDFPAFAREYRRVYQQPNFTLIIRPQSGLAPKDLLTLTNEILQLIYRVERYHQQGVGLIFEEVWLYAPLAAIPEWFQEILLTGRHYKISIVGNSQRPATVSKTMVSQSRHVFIGQFFEARDRKYFRECLGDLPDLDNPPAKFQFIWYRPDAPAMRINV